MKKEDFEKYLKLKEEFSKQKAAFEKEACEIGEQICTELHARGISELDWNLHEHMQDQDYYRFNAAYVGEQWDSKIKDYAEKITTYYEDEYYQEDVFTIMFSPECLWNENKIQEEVDDIAEYWQKKKAEEEARQRKRDIEKLEYLKEKLGEA